MRDVPGHKIFRATNITPAQTLRHRDEHYWFCECGARGLVSPNGVMIRYEALRHYEMAYRSQQDISTDIEVAM